MQRRNILKLLTLFSFWLVSCEKAQSQIERQSKKERVIIIGAGLSGLAAARELKSNGYDVLVLEARERIGGRIWTSQKWQDMPIDLGASWIHGEKNNPLSKLADEIDAKRIATDYENSISFDFDGRELNSSDVGVLDALFSQIENIIAKAQNGNDSDIQSLIDNASGRFENSAKVNRFINFLISGKMEQEYGGSANELSAHYWESTKEFGGDDVIFAKGFGQIADFLAKDITIELGQIVEAIDWRKTQIEIKTQNKIYTADKVIISVPLGVLKSGKITLSPQLPGQKQAAISKIGMGVLDKCYLRFDKAFWPKNVDWIEYVPENQGPWSEWVSFQNASDTPILLGFNSAQNAIAIGKLDNEQIVESAMKTLKVIFGENIPWPKDYQITRWSNDPFSLGSYSFNMVGASPDDRNALFAPIDEKLFFAGEATQKDYFGTAHGAFISGLDAAREIMKPKASPKAD